MISTELDLAKRLFSVRGAQGATSSGSATSLRVGTVTAINPDGSISVKLSDTGETVYLRTSTPVKLGDVVSVIKQGGVYVVYALDALSEQVSAQEQELIDFAGSLGELGQQIDGKVETHFHSYAPTASNVPASEWGDDEKASHAGDLFFDTSTGYAYRWTGSSWSQITDQRIKSALAAASKAEDTADSKRRVFTSQPVSPYDKGDLWVDVSSPGDLKVARYAETSPGRFYANDWVLATSYTDDSLVDSTIETFNMTRQDVTVRVVENKAGSSYRPSVTTASWWTFQPGGDVGASRAPTIGFFSAAIEDLEIRYKMGGSGGFGYSSYYNFVVPWPRAFGDIDNASLPITVLGASPNGAHAQALSWTRGASSGIDCLFMSPYSTSVGATRLEVIAATRP